jgi:hypothetical protein
MSWAPDDGRDAIATDVGAGSSSITKREFQSKLDDCFGRSRRCNYSRVPFLKLLAALRFSPLCKKFGG